MSLWTLWADENAWISRNIRFVKNEEGWWEVQEMSRDALDLIEKQKKTIWIMVWHIKDTKDSILHILNTHHIDADIILIQLPTEMHLEALEPNIIPSDSLNERKNELIIKNMKQMQFENSDSGLELKSYKDRSFENSHKYNNVKPIKTSLGSFKNYKQRKK